MEKNKKRHVILSKALLTLALACTVLFAGGIMAKAETGDITAPGQVTGVKQTKASIDSVSLAWNALSDSGVRYSIQIYDRGEWVEEKTTANTKTTISGLASGTAYKVRVLSYLNNGSKVYGKESAVLEVVTAPSAAPQSLKHTKSTYTSITVKWSKISDINTYLVKYGKAGASSKTYKKVTTKGTSLVLKNLSKNTKYNVYVYAGRKTSNGSFAAYASSYTTLSGISVRPYKVSSLKVPNYADTQGKMHVSCKANKAADGCEWQVYTAYKKKDTKVASKASVFNFSEISKSALKKSNFYKVRVRAYCKDSNGRKYSSPWTSWKYVCPQMKLRLQPLYT